MRKFLIMGICLVSFGVAAQLIDVLGAGAVGGAQTVGSVKSVSRGLSVLQQNQLAQNVNQLVMDIKINYMNGYNGLSKSSFQGSDPFHDLTWDVGNVDNSHFYLTLEGVDTSTCKRLMDLVRGYSNVNVNGQNKSACSNNSKIKWIFE